MSLEYALVPAVDIVPITPSDDTDLPKTARSIRCRPDGTAGEVTVTTGNGQVRTTYIDAGERIPLHVKKVWSTGTDADGLEAMY